LVFREGTIRRPDLTLDILEAALQMTTMMMSQKMMYQTMVMVWVLPVVAVRRMAVTIPLAVVILLAMAVRRMAATAHPTATVHPAVAALPAAVALPTATAVVVVFRMAEEVPQVLLAQEEVAVPLAPQMAAAVVLVQLQVLMAWRPLRRP
jgi:hypothetical protein